MQYVARPHRFDIPAGAVVGVATAELALATDEDGRAIEWAPEPGAPALAGTAVDRIRQAIASQPLMAVELVRVLVDAGHHAAASGRDEQADLTVARCRQADPLPSDLERVVAARNDTPRRRGAERAEEYPAAPSAPTRTI